MVRVFAPLVSPASDSTPPQPGPHEPLSPQTAVFEKVRPTSRPSTCALTELNSKVEPTVAAIDRSLSLMSSSAGFAMEILKASGSPSEVRGYAKARAEEDPAANVSRIETTANLRGKGRLIIMLVAPRQAGKRFCMPRHGNGDVSLPEREK